MEICDSARTATPETPPLVENSCKVQQRRARRPHRAPHRELDHPDVVDVLGIPEIDDQMPSGVTETVVLDEVILLIAGCGRFVAPVVPYDLLTRMDLDLGSGAVRLRSGIHPNLGKRVVAHRSLPQTSSDPEREVQPAVPVHLLGWGTDSHKKGRSLRPRTVGPRT